MDYTRPSLNLLGFLWMIMNVQQKESINMYQRMDTYLHACIYMYMISNTIMGLLRRCRSVRMPSPHNRVMWASVRTHAISKHGKHCIFFILAISRSGYYSVVLNHLVCVMAGIQGLNWEPQKLKVSAEWKKLYSWSESINKLPLFLPSADQWSVNLGCSWEFMGKCLNNRRAV